MPGKEMEIQVSRPLPATYIPLSIDRLIMANADLSTIAGPNATLSTLACATPGCHMAHTCDICHAAFEPPQQGASAYVVGWYAVVQSTNCAHAYHAGCIYDRLYDAPRFVTPRLPCGRCNWFLILPGKELLRAHGVEDVVNDFASGAYRDASGAYGDLDDYDDRYMEVRRRDLNVGIAIAAYYLLMQSLALQPDPSAQYPQGVAAHPDGRAIVGGLVTAVEEAEGKLKSAMLMDEQFPNRALRAMRDAGDDRPYTNEMEEFVHEVIQHAARWYGAHFGFDD